LTKKNFPFSTREDILEHLRDEAKGKNISVNSLINSLLEKHLFYYKLIEKKGMVVIPRRNFQFMLDNLEESFLKESIKRNEFDLNSLVISTKGQITFDSFIKYFLDVIGLNGGFIRHYDIFVDHDGHTDIILEHGYDSKWSNILGSILSELLIDSLNYHTESVYRPKTITIKILEKKL